MTQSQLFIDKQRKLIAGDGHLLSKQASQFSSGVWPGYYSKAKGADVWDLDGHKYCDMSIGGIGATIHGYADEEVDDAVKKAISNGVSSSLLPEEEIQLAELLIELNPWAKKVRFARTGGEAMSIAVRLARASTGADKILFCGYHGWHDWYLSANHNGNDSLEGHLLPGLSARGVPKGLRSSAIPFPYGDLDRLESLLKDNYGEVAAVVMEPIRNIYPDPTYLNDVKKLVEKYNTFLIFDEISSAFRMNSGPAYSLFDVEPHMAVFSKALGNGYAISALVGTDEVMEAANISFISSTCWTERVGPAAAIATITKHRRENTGQHLMSIGEKVQSGWKSIAQKHNLDIDIGGIPPLSHFSFRSDENMSIIKAYYVQEMLKRGFLASNIFYSMGAHSENNVREYLTATDEVWGNMKKHLESPGELRNKLDGEPSHMGFKRMT
ncbi:aminotransferase class III-fold pyridoxal phosphate-dependent enzyme [Psychrobium sp. nBUS_13]|uniref:aminotransferase class III-fold pyridoxal phosphate-dependent enzyme n=1 Tax=Psychrobium sp. nBUS_13 TaxID=3395319 RepID=UPI003EB76D00